MDRKRVLNILGGLMIALGVVWVVLGLRLFHGSAHAAGGQISWAGWGAWLVMFGAGLLVWNNRPPKGAGR